jgi:hypothetical protein
MTDSENKDKFAWRNWGCGLVFVVCATGFFILLWSTAGPFRVVRGQGVSSDEANQMLWTNLVPASATDVWFESSYFATKTDCKLDEAEFLDWCHRKDWQPKPISEKKYVYIDRLKDVATVESGFVFDAKYGNAGRGSSGIYDATAGRAYVLYAGR